MNGLGKRPREKPLWLQGPNWEHQDAGALWFTMGVTNDEDGDGLSHAAEAQFCPPLRDCDATNDVDWDGLRDDFEWHYEGHATFPLHPATPNAGGAAPGSNTNAFADVDKDGLDYLVEHALRTIPANNQDILVEIDGMCTELNGQPGCQRTSRGECGEFSEPVERNLPWSGRARILLRSGPAVTPTASPPHARAPAAAHSAAAHGNPYAPTSGTNTHPPRSSRSSPPGPFVARVRSQ